MGRARFSARQFFAANRRLFLLILALCLFEALYIFTASGIDHTLDVPISLDPPTGVQQQLLVVMPTEYALVLRLDRRDDEEKWRVLYDEVGKIHGQSFPDSPKVHIPIRWYLVHAGSKEVSYQGITDTPRGLGIGHDFWVVLDRRKLGIGWYVFYAQPLAPQPYLQQLHPRLKLWSDPKVAGSWEMRLFMLVGFAQICLMPLAFLLFLILAFRAIRSLATH